MPPIANVCTNSTLFTTTNRLFTITDKLFAATNGLFTTTDGLLNAANGLPGVPNVLITRTVRLRGMPYGLSQESRPMA